MESLSPNRRGQKPPPPPPRSYTGTDDSQGEPAAKHPKLDYATNLPQKPPRAQVAEGNGDTDFVNVGNDSRTVPSKRQEENRQLSEMDSENNNPNKEEGGTKEDERRGFEGANSYEGGANNVDRDEQTGNSVSQGAR